MINKYLDLKENKKIVDIGGGTGVITDLLVKKGNKATIVDPSVKLLSKVKNPSILLIRGDGCSVPIMDGFFDIAILINTLHHIKKIEQKRVLLETLRILKYGGKLFIMDVRPPDILVKKIFAIFDKICSGGEICYLSPSQLNSELKLIGFKKIKMFFPMQEKNPKEQKWIYAALAIK